MRGGVWGQPARSYHFNLVDPEVVVVPSQVIIVKLVNHPILLKCLEQYLVASIC